MGGLCHVMFLLSLLAHFPLFTAIDSVEHLPVWPTILMANEGRRPTLSPFFHSELVGF